MGDDDDVVISLGVDFSEMCFFLCFVRLSRVLIITVSKVFKCFRAGFAIKTELLKRKKKNSNQNKKK